MTTEQIFEKTLRNAHMSTTAPRQAVFAALQHHRSLDISQLVTACPQVNRASVYRTVSLFEQLDIIIRIPNGWKYRLELGEAFHEHHHHATCTSCGGSIALPEDALLETRLHAIAQQRNFALSSHQIELSGVCEACQTHA